MMRLYTLPRWFQRFYPEASWSVAPSAQKTIYLTFDDGPYPGTTPWLLDCLRQFDAKATFFCTGGQAEKEPRLMEEIRSAGHLVGSHTYSHLNGWKSGVRNYCDDALRASEIIGNKLFRPPFGRIRHRQYRTLLGQGFRIVFWSVMAYDFDATLKSETRLEQIKSNTGDGSIIVLHDSPKAFPQVKGELHELLQNWKGCGFHFSILP